MTWFVLAAALGATLLAARMAMGRGEQREAAQAAGLRAVADLTHLSEALQRTALWALADGGFERRVVHGMVTRGAQDLDVTAFDLETLRERRGEWAYLPVDPPFRIGGVVSVVACGLDRRFEHVLLKRIGAGDELADDGHLDRARHVAKLARDVLRVPRKYPAELPPTLRADRLEVAVPEGWRAYGSAGQLSVLLAEGFAGTLAGIERRDLVIELLDGLVVVYPAARDVVSADALADLTAITLQLAEGLLRASPRCSPRGVGSTP